MNTAQPAITPLRETWRQLMVSVHYRASHLCASLIGLAFASEISVSGTVGFIFF